MWNPVADKGQHGTKQFSRCWLRSSYHAGRPELILCYFIGSFLWPNTFVVPPDKGSLPFRSVKWLTTKQESENSWRRRTCMNKNGWISCWRIHASQLFRTARLDCVNVQVCMWRVDPRHGLHKEPKCQKFEQVLPRPVSWSAYFFVWLWIPVDSPSGYVHKDSGKLRRSNDKLAIGIIIFKM